MEPSNKLSEFSINSPKLTISLICIVAIVLGIITALPSIWPEKYPSMYGLKIDTDPENMLSKDEPIRLFHNKMKKEFNLYDMIVVGVENTKHKNGVFNSKSLNHIYQLSEYAKTLQWIDPKNKDKKIGVISKNIVAPSTVENIKSLKEGEILFEWLMSKPNVSEKEALIIRDKALRIPFLNDTMVSKDGKALAIYLPISSKDMSYKISQALENKIKEFSGDDEFHITGLPVANDTFGVEMFKQMFSTGPMAMVMIFILLFWFFKKFILILSPMILAGISVTYAMSLLIISGNTVHIMSSMIPIFIMPIAVLDSVHLLSEFFDKYPNIKDKKQTLKEVLKELYWPMLYTSLTSTAGFASLALTPIPPVQVFGIFVGIGVMLAWFFTITFIPAYIMLIPQSMLENFGAKTSSDNKNESFGSILKWLNQFTYHKTKTIFTVAIVMMIVAVYGITKIQINDNPVLWFNYDHKIRKADRVLNSHFGGTYMAYLTLESTKENTVAQFGIDVKNSWNKSLVHFNGIRPILKTLNENWSSYIKQNSLMTKSQLVDGFIENYLEKQLDQADDDSYEIFDEALSLLELEKSKEDTFKQPEILNFMSDLQSYLLTTGIVGKSNSISDIVKTIHRELRNSDDKEYKIPKSSLAVAQCLITYQNSHRPQDLWHLVTPDYKRTSIWLQLNSGNNKDMVKVSKAVDEFMAKNAKKYHLKHNWFGLTYINVMWQDKMVSGMLQAFLGSFLVVFIMMSVLFRSTLWGILSMIPLSITIAFIYGMVGLLGKDYDMPIALLSSLTLGLAVDFAIHFLVRARETVIHYGSWKLAKQEMFQEPTRAIIRNLIVVAVGFTPLLTATLIPYQTVGVFLATILTIAGISTLVFIPALIKVLEPKLFFNKNSKKMTYSSHVVIILSSVSLVVINLHQLLEISFMAMMPQAMIATFVLLMISYFISKKGRN
ncbi:MAG: RND transporter [Candidatus Cloacimonadota bacterium]|nr:MAG: RND transporter [Candidatus Cloacimonadota bacterium]